MGGGGETYMARLALSQLSALPAVHHRYQGIAGITVNNGGNLASKSDKAISILLCVLFYGTKIKYMYV